MTIIKIYQHTGWVLQVGSNELSGAGRGLGQGGGRTEGLGSVATAAWARRRLLSVLNTGIVRGNYILLRAPHIEFNFYINRSAKIGRNTRENLEIVVSNLILLYG